MSIGSETAGSAGVSTSANNPGFTNLTETGLTVAVSNVGQVYIVAYGNLAGGGDLLYGVAITVKRPKP